MLKYDSYINDDLDCIAISLEEEDFENLYPVERASINITEDHCHYLSRNLLVSSDKILTLSDLFDMNFNILTWSL